MLWNNFTVVEATNGKVFGLWEANKICIDTRKIEKHDLFIAFRGENVDGHTYVAEALAKGASAAMVEHIPDNVDKTKLIIVKDCQKALEDLAIYNRKRLQAKIIGVTGSVGKTSTKESLYLAFSALGETYTSKGNFNNHLGLPISLASIPTSAKYAIFEMGMSNPGEMTHLTSLARPDVAIITNITGVHRANFNSEEEIAKAKSEIFLGLNKSGAAILNNESKYINIQIDEAKKQGIANIITFGEGGDSFLLDYKVKDNGIDVIANIMGSKVNYHLSSYGLHHVSNSLAVLASVKFLGGDLERAAANLVSFKNIKGRGEVSTVNLANKSITLIDDSYNASPLSIKAALAVMSSNFNEANRKVAILGDMRELGPNEIVEHISLAQDLIKNKIDKVITIGKLMKNLYEALPKNMRLMHYNNVDDSFGTILNMLANDDVVLVKGSNGTKVYKLIDYIKGSE